MLVYSHYTADIDSILAIVIVYAVYLIGVGLVSLFSQLIWILFLPLTVSVQCIWLLWVYSHCVSYIDSVLVIKNVCAMYLIGVGVGLLSMFQRWCWFCSCHKQRLCSVFNRCCSTHYKIIADDSRFCSCHWQCQFSVSDRLLDRSTRTV